MEALLPRARFRIGSDAGAGRRTWTQAPQRFDPSKAIEGPITHPVRSGDGRTTARGGGAIEAKPASGDARFARVGSHSRGMLAANPLRPVDFYLPVGQ